MEKFTAREVRNHLARSQQNERTIYDKSVTYEMLHAFADMLEAQEKAVPVAYILKHDRINFMPTLYYGEAETLQRTHGGKIVKLYDHSASADAERLAEALRRTCRKMKTFSRTGALDGAVAVWVDEIESVLAAHPAQAQPPAASVTDAMVERACKKYAFREDGAAFPDAYSDEEVLAERTLMREFLEHVLLVAQENPNG